METNGKNLIRTIIQWALTVIYLIFAFGYLPALSGWGYLIGAIIIVPIKPVEDFFEKCRITFKIRIIAVIAILLIHLVSFLIAGGYV